MSDKRQAVLTEAAIWLGTPYHHHGRVMGVGVDCAMLLAEVYERCGLIPPVDPGFYPPAWHFHQSQELYLEWLLQFADPVEHPLPGDVVLYKFGKVGSHAGIVVAWPTIIHAYLRQGCVKADGTAGDLEGRLQGFYRLRGLR